MRKLGRLMVSPRIWDRGAHAKLWKVAISLIPYTYQALVIKSAIRKNVNVVTTSYISDSIEEPRKEIDGAGITVMNEIGLDPGIVGAVQCKPIVLCPTRKF